MSGKTKPISSSLVGYAYYVFNNKPQLDKENDKYFYRLDLVLTEADGNPIVVKNKKTGENVNMLERAKELGLIIKEPRGQIEGTYVRLKRQVKTLKDGNETSPPETKTVSGEDFTDIIGNGSKVKVDLAAIEIPKGPSKGQFTAYLNAITVINHVPYITNSEEFDFADDFSNKKNEKVAQKKKQEQDEDFSDDVEEETLELED